MRQDGMRERGRLREIEEPWPGWSARMPGAGQQGSRGLLPGRRRDLPVARVHVVSAVGVVRCLHGTASMARGKPRGSRSAKDDARHPARAARPCRRPAVSYGVDGGAGARCRNRRVAGGDRRRGRGRHGDGDGAGRGVRLALHGLGRAASRRLLARVAGAIRAVLGAGATAPSAIRAVGLRQMHGGVLLDASGEVVRPALIW